MPLSKFPQLSLFFFSPPQVLILTVGAGYGRNTLPRQRRSHRLSRAVRVFRARPPATSQTGHPSGGRKAVKEKRRICLCDRAGVRDARGCLHSIWFTSMNRTCVRASGWRVSHMGNSCVLELLLPFPLSREPGVNEKGGLKTTTTTTNK